MKVKYEDVEIEGDAEELRYFFMGPEKESISFGLIVPELKKLSKKVKKKKTTNKKAGRPKGLKGKKWTKQEVQKMKIMRKKGSKWKDVAANLGRNQRACINKFSRV